MYANGVGTNQDLRKGAIWSGAAAKQGNKNAKSNLAAFCFELGMVYFGMEDSPKSLSLAYMWLSLGAKNGNRLAAGTLDVLELTLTHAVRRRARALMRKCERSGYKTCG